MDRSGPSYGWTNYRKSGKIRSLPSEIPNHEPARIRSVPTPHLCRRGGIRHRIGGGGAGFPVAIVGKRAAKKPRRAHPPPPLPAPQAPHTHHPPPPHATPSPP